MFDKIIHNEVIHEEKAKIITQLIKNTNINKKYSTNQFSIQLK
jgi:hypothetical protein